MRKKDLPLVFFTLLTQAAVGCFTTSFLVYVSQRSAAERASLEGFMGVSTTVTLVLLVSGLLIATRHLRRPSKGYLAIANTVTSWLSREMLLGIGFGLSVLGFAVAHFLNFRSPWVGAVGAILGLGLVYAISRLYMLRTVPSWNNPATPMSFLTTTLLVGTALTSTALRLTAGEVQVPGGLPETLAITALALTGIQALAIRISLRYSRKHRGFPSYNDFQKTFLSRVLLSAVGAVLLWISTTGLLGPSTYALTAMSFFIGAAFLIAGEVLGRFLFFAIYKRVGL